jgi:hypothetical protein
MRLSTDPPLCVDSVKGYRKRSGETTTYYKVLRSENGRKHYVCYLSKADMQRIKDGVPAYKILSEKGVQCSTAKPKSHKHVQSQVNHFWIEHKVAMLSDRSSARSHTYNEGVRVYVFKRGNRAYVRIKSLLIKDQIWNYGEFKNETSSKSLHYVGTVEAEKVWNNEQGLASFLREHDYNVVCTMLYRKPERKRKRSAKPGFESESEWVQNQKEQGDVEPVLDRYESAGEFLEACPDDEETARELYGDDKVDEHYGKSKNDHYDDEYKNEDDEPEEY